MSGRPDATSYAAAEPLQGILIVSLGPRFSRPGRYPAPGAVCFAGRPSRPALLTGAGRRLGGAFLRRGPAKPGARAANVRQTRDVRRRRSAWSVEIPCALAARIPPGPEPR